LEQSFLELKIACGERQPWRPRGLGLYVSDLTIGHRFSISAWWKAPSASGVRFSSDGIN